MSAYPETKSRNEMFRFVLRRETRAEHGDLDRHPVFASLLDGTMSLEGYRNLMLAFHGFYLSVEEPLQQACARHGLDLMGFVYEPRAAILAGDLEAIGADAALVKRKPPAERKIHMDAVEALAGALYVFEGSLLGASMMCASTDALLERTGSKGNAYWKWCREAGSRRWAMTCQLIEKLATTDQAKGRMVDGAQSAFRSFSDWLNHWDAGLCRRSPKQC